MQATIPFLPFPPNPAGNRLLLLLLSLLQLSTKMRAANLAVWRDPQYEPSMEVPSPLRYRPSPFLADSYRLHCHSCMSPYLEDQFQYIAHLYRRPMVFSEKCDHGLFDWRYVRSKNCTDACVTLRMNDRVGGRRRYGFMRGCLSDIIHHNRTAVRFGELSRTTKSGASICTAIRLRDLFVSSERYGFDPHDHVDLCACIRPNCNWATGKGRPNDLLLGLALALLAMLALLRVDLARESGQPGRTKAADVGRTVDMAGGHWREEKREKGIAVERRAAVKGGREEALEG